MKIMNLEEILQRIDLPKIIEMQKQGFSLLSKGLVDVPTPGYLEQHNPIGSYHIKYGLVKDDPYWVVKIAGGPNALPANGVF